MTASYTGCSVGGVHVLSYILLGYIQTLGYPTYVEGP